MSKYRVSLVFDAPGGSGAADWNRNGYGIGERDLPSLRRHHVIRIASDIPANAD
jgi:hypothetical protein